jgi:hypothetical protein
VDRALDVAHAQHDVIDAADLDRAHAHTVLRLTFAARARTLARP